MDMDLTYIIEKCESIESKINNISTELKSLIDIASMDIKVIGINTSGKNPVYCITVTIDSYDLSEKEILDFETGLKSVFSNLKIIWI